MESFVSPKANTYTKLFSKEAIQVILDVFTRLVEQGEAYRFEKLEDMLIASNYAGIAFGNVGVGAVHAFSYPLGGKYHVPHGEANCQFLTEIFKLYNKKAPTGVIQDLNALLSQRLQQSKTMGNDVYEKLDLLLANLISKKQLRTYGMTKEEIERFAQSVLETHNVY